MGSGGILGGDERGRRVGREGCGEWGGDLKGEESDFGGDLGVWSVGG